MTDIHFAQVDSLLESVYCETMWGSGSLVKIIASTLEPILKKSQFLAGGNKISMVDVYVFSLIAKEKGGKHSQVLTEWLKRCDQAITAFQVVDKNCILTKNPKSKSPIKKSKQQRGMKEIQGNRPGATLQHQWPEIESVYLATGTMIDLLKTDPISLVSEKLDGSNLSVSSSGVISSRRKIILVNPSNDELKNTKFAGEPLTSLQKIMKTCQILAENFQKNLRINFDVTIFGEWLQSGTASTKEDKFSYVDRGLKKGQLYAFGLGLAMPEGQNMSNEDQKRVQNWFDSKGFATMVVGDFIILILNAELKHLFTKHSIMTVPILNTLPFVKVFDKMADDLLRHQVEGFVITVPSKGIILKWKGYEDSDPRRVESFIDITDHCKLAKAIGPLNQVLQESILYNAHGRKRYHDLNLSNAFQSARSKFPRLDDILSNFSGNPKLKAEIIEGYKFTIVDEITKDFGKAFGCTKKSIEAFVNHEVMP